MKKITKIKRCFVKYGNISSFDMKTSKIDEALKYGCGMSLMYPEVLQLISIQTLMNETSYNEMCKRVEDTEENNIKIQQCFSKYGASNQIKILMLVSVPRNEINKTLCALDCALPELGNAMHEMIRKRIGGLFNPECKGLEIVSSETAKNGTDQAS